MKSTTSSQTSSELQEQEADSNTRALSLAKRLWREYADAYRGRIGLSVVFMVLMSLANNSLPIVVQWVFSAFQEPTEGANFSATPNQVMLFAPPLLLAVGILLSISRWMYARLSQGTAVLVLRDLQKGMFKNFLRYDFAQTREDGSGQLVSRFTNDILILRESLIRAPNGARDIVNLIGTICVLIYIDWLLFLIVIVTYPIVGLPIIALSKKLRRTAKKVQGQVGDMTSQLTESMRGARLVKTYHLECYEAKRAGQSFDERQKLLRKVINTKALNDPLITMVGTISVSVVIGVAAWRVSTGEMGGNDLVAFIVALLLLSQPARGLGTLNAVLQEGFAALERVFWVIDRKPQIVDKADAVALTYDPEQQGTDVIFDNVSFAYGADDVLRSFSLHVKAGQTVALVGESGAGKSTVFNLLPRLYEVGSGKVFVNGQNIKDVTMRSLREGIAFVSQEATLFDDTVLANIQFGKEGANLAEIKAAAKNAAADEFISEMPEEYNTTVGEGGGSLSGGQRQRIALARAFLKNAPVLLLDEATSALDAESERKVQEALARLSQNRTTIVIAHRLSTVRNADLICVMDHGKIIEQGKHDELLARDGMYAKLAALQFRDD